MSVSEDTKPVYRFREGKSPFITLPPEEESPATPLVRGGQNYFPDGVKMRKTPLSFSFSRGYEASPGLLSESCPRSSAPLHLLRLPTTAQPKKRNSGAYSSFSNEINYYDSARHRSKVLPATAGASLSSHVHLGPMLPVLPLNSSNPVSPQRALPLSRHSSYGSASDVEPEVADYESYNFDERYLSDDEIFPEIDLSLLFCNRAETKKDDVTITSPKSIPSSRTTSFSSPEPSTTSSLSHDDLRDEVTSPSSVVDVREERASFKVQVRIKPLDEQNEGRTSNRLRCVSVKSKQQLTLSTRPSLKKENNGNKHSFKFDHVLDENSTQKDAYDVTTGPLVENTLKGYHSCLIAYGSPGTGKSHSLYGKASSGKYKGMIIRAAEALINAVDKTSANQKTDISMSFVQLYNEKFYDILDPSATDNIKFRDSGDIHLLEGVTDLKVENSEDVTKQLRRNPNRLRDGGRSHTVFTLHFRKEEELTGDDEAKVKTFRTTHGRLDFVDLIGVSRPTKHSTHDSTGNNATAKANKSLQVFGNVVWALTGKETQYPPYRDSRLTRYLREAMGGNCVTSLLVTASSCPNSAHETLSCLMFAKRAMGVRNYPAPYLSLENVEEGPTQNDVISNDEVGEQPNIKQAKSDEIKHTSITSPKPNTPKKEATTPATSTQSPPIQKKRSHHSKVLPPINSRDANGESPELIPNEVSQASTGVNTKDAQKNSRSRTFHRKQTSKDLSGDEPADEKRKSEKSKKLKRKSKTKTPEEVPPQYWQINGGDGSGTPSQGVVLPQITTPDQIRQESNHLDGSDAKSRRRSLSKKNSPLADAANFPSSWDRNPTSSSSNKEESLEERKTRCVIDSILHKSNSRSSDRKEAFAMLPPSTSELPMTKSQVEIGIESTNPPGLLPSSQVDYPCCVRCQEREEKIKRNYDRMILFSKKDRDVKQSRIEELELRIQKAQTVPLPELQRIAEEQVKDKQAMTRLKDSIEKYKKQLSTMVSATELSHLKELRRKDQTIIAEKEREVDTLRKNLDDQIKGASKLLSKKSEQNDALKSELEALKEELSEKMEESRREVDRMQTKLKDVESEKEKVSTKYDALLKESSVKLACALAQVSQLKESNVDVIREHDKAKEQLNREISILTKQLSDALSSKSRPKTGESKRKLSFPIKCDSSTNTENVKSRLNGLAYSVHCLRCAAQTVLERDESGECPSLKDTELRILLLQDTKNRELLLQLKRERNLLRDVMKIMYCRQWFTEEGNPHVKRTLKRVGIDTRELVVVKKP
ncbi:unnamed protein product [Clavelina lepadiformis]|uniref:Kinesin motor domain-containing protein n=1 Tax=Clavelina lepadiformis TaxID=159417 RepID=A0ABP0GNG0_CLALP